MSDRPPDLTPNEIVAALKGRTIAEVDALNEDWIGLTFTDQTELEIQAVWMNTSDACLGVMQGRFIRDIYGR